MAKDEKAVEPAPEGGRLDLFKQIQQMVESPEETQERILANILAAESIEDVFGGSYVVSSADCVGTPVRITGMSVRESNKFQNSPFYVSFDATDLRTEKALVINSSSPTAAVKILKCQQLGKLPVDVVFTKKDTPTAAGFYPLDLRLATEAEVANQKANGKALAGFAPVTDANGNDPF